MIIPLFAFQILPMQTDWKDSLIQKMKTLKSYLFKEQ